MRQVLAGLRIIEVGQGVAAGYCGKVFADLGAEVWKVEQPGGDPLRGRPAAWAHLATNKRSTVSDPKSAEDRQALRGLVAGADLVIEVERAGTLADHGFDRAELRSAQPELVVVSISGFGATGPYAGYRWSDVTTQAFTGTVAGQAPHRDGPLRLPGVVGLCAAGQAAALGALAALLVVEAGGGGTVVDAAAYEAAVSVPARSSQQLAAEYRGRKPAPVRTVKSGTTLFPVGIFPCADGYVAMMSNGQQLPEMLTVLDDEPLRAAFAHPDAMTRPETREALDVALYTWLSSHTRAEITGAGQTAGWPIAGVNTMTDVLAADHLYQRRFWATVEEPNVGMSVRLPAGPIRFAEGGWDLRRRAPLLDEDAPLAGVTAAATPRARARVARPPAPPLHGVRVLDLTTVWSGPYVTLLLADLGADVIRLENPYVFPPTTKGYSPRVDAGAVTGTDSGGTPFAPTLPGRPDRSFNRAAWNNAVSRNKRSCTLDLRSEAGRTSLLDLVARADVVVENLKAQTLHQIGVHESELLRRNPRLVVLRIPPAGLTGDWAHYTGFGAQFDGLTGLASVTGHRGSDLSDSPATTYMDGVTGPVGAFAVLAALRYRQATGRGQVVELAQCENVLNHLGDLLVGAQVDGDPPRWGNRDPQRAPQGFYRCQDGWLAVSIGDDDEWRSLCEVLDRGDLAADPSLATLAGRHARHDELDRVIQAWADGRDRVDAFHDLQNGGVTAAPHLDPIEFAVDRHVQARGLLREATSRDVGTHLHVGHIFKGVPQEWHRGAPALGEDNAYVYKELLGFDDAAYQDLVAQKIAVEDYLDPNGNPW